MKKVEKVLDTVMRFLMALAMLTLLVFGTWQIFTRWVLGNPSTFTDELLRYVLIIAGFIGSAYCFYRDEHLALTLVTDKAKGPFKLALDIFIEICILFFVIYVFIYGGFKLANTAMKSLYMVEPICGILIVLARILKYVNMYTEKKGENK